MLDDDGGVSVAHFWLSHRIEFVRVFAEGGQAIRNIARTIYGATIHFTYLFWL